MSEQHVINLSTAWQPPGDGSRAWVRRFGRPAGIESGDRVWLVLDGGEGASLVLNGMGLAAAGGRHDVTALLEPRNELLLVPTTSEPAIATPVDAPGPVALPDGRRPLDPRFGRLRLEIESHLP
jgi:hypothetical protein